MTTRSGLDIARELEAWADFGSPAAPSEQTLREAAEKLRELERRADDAEISLYKWEKKAPDDIRATLEEIDVLVPESDPAYDTPEKRDILDERRDNYVRLMYQAADGCAALLREVDRLQSIIRAEGPVGEANLFAEQVVQRARK